MISIEPNDTLALANFIEFEDSSVEIITGEIGDNAARENDVDLFAVRLDAGETIIANIDANINESPLDSVITIFDAVGNLLVQNDDNSFELEGEPVTEVDPFQQFTAIEAGIYYVGVSSYPNLEYNPNLAGSGNGNTSGSYSLELRLGELNADGLAAEPNDTIRFANPVELDSSEPVVISGVIGDNTALLSAEDDVDLFEVELEAGETLLADINADLIGSSLDSVLTIFDLNGNLWAQNEDNSFEEDGEIRTEADPFQAFTAPEDGTYYVGVSSAGNLDYDPNVFVSGIGESSGFYNLVLSFGEEMAENEMDDIVPKERFSNTGIGDRNPTDSILNDRIPEDSTTNIVERIITTDSSFTL